MTQSKTYRDKAREASFWFGEVRRPNARRLLGGGGAEITEDTYEAFMPGDTKIARLELSMVLFALSTRAATFRGRRGVWFIDNAAALMALIRSTSGFPDVERLANLIHVALFSLETWIYWELWGKVHWESEPW